MDCSLKDIMAEMFKVDKEIIHDNLKQGDIGEWDSLGHLTLFMALESRFGIKFTLNEISANLSYSDIRRLLWEKGIQCR